MLPTVAALAAAIAVTVAYLALTEHLDYASLRRRQLDAWAAMAALGCMGLILYGNATVRHSAHRLRVDEPMAATETAGPPVPRRTSAPTPAPEIAPAGGSLRVAAAPDDVSAGPEAGLLAEGQGPAIGGETLGHAMPTSEMPVMGLPPAIVATPTLVQSSFEPVPASPTAFAGGGVTPLPQPTRTRPAPTAVAPTDVPVPQPTATVQCGNPREIDVDIANLRTERRNQNGDLVVEYGFDLRNNSSFPVTLTKITVIVVRREGGSEQFARQILDNVTIEPGAVFPVERRITLERRPPPVGSVQLCVSYVAESCGLRPDPEPGGNQCQTVEGL